MQKKYVLPWLYLVIFAPLQSILAIVGNNQALFGGWYLYLDLTLRISLIILPLVWYFLVDKKKFRFTLPTFSEVTISLIVGSFFAGMILLGYFLILKPNLTFDTTNYQFFSKEAFIIFSMLISFLNAFSEEFNYRYTIFNKLQALNNSTFVATFLTGLIFVPLFAIFNTRFSRSGTLCCWF